MMGVFSENVYRFAPSWFQGPYMGAFLKAVASAYDDMAQRVFDGRRASNPYAAGSRTDAGILRECDASELAYHARDRGIRLYDTEALLSKRFRLSRFRQLKKLRGSHPGELQNLQPFWLSESTSVLPTMRVVFQNNRGTPGAEWYTLGPTGLLSKRQRSTSNWNYDDRPELRARFWVIIHLPPGYSSGIYYDDGASVYDGGAVYDGISTRAIADMVDAIKEAKSAHSRLAGIIATTLQPTDLIPDAVGTHYPFDPTDTAQTLTDGSTSLPVGNWGSIVDASTGLPTRPAWASWIFEDNQ
jgi:hypothetical protein